MGGKYFEELEVGHVFRHEPGRTITEADNLFFSALTMNPQPLHLDATFAVWEATERGLRESAGLRGLLLERIAQAYEDAGRWQEAATKHEEAAALEGFPLRHWARVGAARCFARAGQNERALELFERVEADAPDLNLPTHVRVRLRELRTAAP